MARDRKSLVDFLRRLGYTQAADEAARALPDPVSREQARKFAQRYGISRDELISRMGGSP
jgi:hypothetical protein